MSSLAIRNTCFSEDGSRVCTKQVGVKVSKLELDFFLLSDFFRQASMRRKRGHRSLFRDLPLPNGTAIRPHSGLAGEPDRQLRKFKRRVDAAPSQSGSCPRLRRKVPQIQESVRGPLSGVRGRARLLKLAWHALRRFACVNGHCRSELRAGARSEA